MLQLRPEVSLIDGKLGKVVTEQETKIPQHTVLAVLAVCIGCNSDPLASAR